VFTLAFTPDGRTLASGSWNGTVKFWDVASGRVRETLSGHTGRAWAVAWSPDGRTVASCEWDQTIWLWDVERRSYQAVLHGHGAGRTPPRMLRGHRWNVYGVAWSPDGRFLASSGWDNAVRVWDATTGADVRILRDPDGVDTSFYGVAWSPDGTFLASGSYQQGVQVWEVTTGTRRWVGRSQPTRTRRVAWSPDGTRLASGGEDCSVCLWRASDGMVLL